MEMMIDSKSPEVKSFEEYFDKLKENAVKIFKEKRGIQDYFDMANYYGRKAFICRSRKDCNKMIINAAIASYLAKAMSEED